MNLKHSYSRFVLEDKRNDGVVLEKKKKKLLDFEIQSLLLNKVDCHGYSRRSLCGVSLCNFWFSYANNFITNPIIRNFIIVYKCHIKFIKIDCFKLYIYVCLTLTNMT
jgi:hypothetical protein